MENIIAGSASLFAGQIEHTIEENLASIIANRPTYTKDGLLYCAICDEPMQKKVKPPINRIVNIDCLCDRVAREEKEAKKRRDAADKRRKIAFGSANSKKLAFTLQADDRRNPLASQQIATYCEHFDEHRKDGRGLLLYSVHNGGGKTFFASAAANELIDRGYAVRVTNFADLRDEMTDYKAFGHLNREDFIHKLRALDLIVIDDLGAENDTQYTTEIEYRIIDDLTDNRVPLIVTTNHTPKEMDGVTDRAKKRIFERIIGNCIPIKIDPPEKVDDHHISRRIEQCKQNTVAFYESLGSL